MVIYIIKKIVVFLLVLFLLSLISFSLVYFYADFPANEATFKESYLLFYQQFLSGELVITNQTENLFIQNINHVLISTFELFILTAICASVLGIPIGIAVGLTEKRNRNYITKLICLILYAMPIVWIAILLVLLFYPNYTYSADTNIFSAINALSMLDILLSNDSNKFRILINELYYLSPIILALTIQPCIMTIQLISQQVAEVIEQNYIRVIKIRENSSLKILIRHVLPNVLPKVIPQMAYNITTLLFSIMVAEILFNRIGLGIWVFTAFYGHYFTILAIAIFCCGAFISFFTLLSDIAIVLLYPMRYKELYES